MRLHSREVYRLGYGRNFIDFIDHPESVDLADVNPEYFDIGRIVERLQDLRALDPEGYKEFGEILWFMSSINVCPDGTDADRI
jgi:hypothetical protein